MFSSEPKAAPNPDVFKNHFERGMEAFNRSEFRIAKVHFVDAALALEKIIDSTYLPDVRTIRKETLVELTELAELCDEAEAKRVSYKATSARGDTAPATARKTGQGSDEVVLNVADFLFKDSRVRFDEIIGHQYAKERLSDTMILPFRHPERFRKKGLQPGGALLLFGPAGTGKTDLAAAAAAEVDADFYNVRCSDLLTKWYGDSEKQVKALFSGIRKASPRSILFLDDCTSLFASPNDGSTSDVGRRVKGEFLVELNGLAARGAERSAEMLVIAATNEPWIIAPEMLRRFQLGGGIVYMPLPETSEREAIFKIKCVRDELDNDVDFAELAVATAGYSGSDITTICHGARLAALKEGIAQNTEHPIAQRHLLEQVRRVKPATSRELLERFEEWNSKHGAH
jgi:SpoVK/Ycf46/Vps4 family AAA+-type ATPase